MYPAENLRDHPLLSERTFGREQDGGGQCVLEKRISPPQRECRGDPASPPAQWLILHSTQPALPAPPPPPTHTSPGCNREIRGNLPVSLGLETGSPGTLACWELGQRPR